MSNLRKVLFKKWIPRQVKDGDIDACQNALPGTNCFSDFIHEGLFHQWANSYEESSAGFGNFTVALIELADGTMHEAIPSHVKFVTEEKTEINTYLIEFRFLDKDDFIRHRATNEVEARTTFEELYPNFKITSITKQTYE